MIMNLEMRWLIACFCFVFCQLSYFCHFSCPALTRDKVKVRAKHNQHFSNISIIIFRICLCVFFILPFIRDFVGMNLAKRDIIVHKNWNFRDWVIRVLVHCTTNIIIILISIVVKSHFPSIAGTICKRLMCNAIWQSAIEIEEIIFTAVSFRIIEMHDMIFQYMILFPIPNSNIYSIILYVSTNTTGSVACQCKAIKFVIILTAHSILYETQFFVVAAASSSICSCMAIEPLSKLCGSWRQDMRMIIVPMTIMAMMMAVMIVFGWCEKQWHNAHKTQHETCLYIYT